MSDTKFTNVAPIAWGAVVVVTLGIFFGTLLINKEKRS